VHVRGLVHVLLARLMLMRLLQTFKHSSTVVYEGLYNACGYTMVKVSISDNFIKLLYCTIYRDSIDIGTCGLFMGVP